MHALAPGTAGATIVAIFLSVLTASCQLFGPDTGIGEFDDYFPVRLGESVQEVTDRLGTPDELLMGDCACGTARYHTGPANATTFGFVETDDEFVVTDVAVASPYARRTSSGLTAASNRTEIRRVLGRPSADSLSIAYAGLKGDVTVVTTVSGADLYVREETALAITYKESGAVERIRQIALTTPGR